MMTIKELYITSNQTEQKVVAHIADDQWELTMPVHKQNYLQWLGESSSEKRTRRQALRLGEDWL